ASMPRAAASRSMRSAAPLGPSIQVALAHRRLDGLSPAESLVQTMVVGDRFFAVPPAQPHELSVDLPVKVEEPRARILEDRPEIFHLAPGRLVALDSGDEVDLQSPNLGRVVVVERDRARDPADQLRELTDPLFDLAATGHLSRH